MTIYFGNTKEKTLYHGNNKIKTAYYGDKKVYDSSGSGSVLFYCYLNSGSGSSGYFTEEATYVGQTLDFYAKSDFSGDPASDSSELVRFYTFIVTAISSGVVTGYNDIMGPGNTLTYVKHAAGDLYT